MACKMVGSTMSCPMAVEMKCERFEPLSDQMLQISVTLSMTIALQKYAPSIKVNDILAPISVYVGSEVLFTKKRGGGAFFTEVEGHIQKIFLRNSSIKEDFLEL